jgi:hypothetical protein
MLNDTIHHSPELQTYKLIIKKTVFFFLATDYPYPSSYLRDVWYAGFIAHGIQKLYCHFDYTTLRHIWALAPGLDYLY